MIVVNPRNHRVKRHIIILLFETLQIWSKWIFVINQVWATAPMDLKNHDGTKKIAKK